LGGELECTRGLLDRLKAHGIDILYENTARTMHSAGCPETSANILQSKQAIQRAKREQIPPFKLAILHGVFLSGSERPK